ncbi:hypothetical protein PTKIN_Ptkin13bG0244700 [Pterospermum kingtungense]
MDLASAVGSGAAVRVDGSLRENSNQTQFFYLMVIPLRVSVCRQNQMIWSGLNWQKGMKYVIDKICEFHGPSMKVHVVAHCWRLVHPHSSHGRIYLCNSNSFSVLHQLFNVLQA